MNRDLRTLARASRDEHDRVFRQGTPPAIDDIVGWEFEGLNCSLVPKIAGFEKFVKGFYRGAATAERVCEGFNAVVIQNGADGEWLGLPSDDEPTRHGFYRVATFEPPGSPPTLLLDYGAHPANPRLDVSRLLRDFLVKIEGSADHLLGRAHLALGRWLFAGYFLLERRRPHDYAGPRAP